MQPAVNGKDTILAALQLAVQAKQVEKSRRGRILLPD
jgi:hypothetical protein